MADDNYCVICGRIIPEGIIVCPLCEKAVMNQSAKKGGVGFTRQEPNMKEKRFLKSRRRNRKEKETV